MILTIEHTSSRKIEDVTIDTTDNLYKVDKDYFVETAKQNDLPSGHYLAKFEDQTIEFTF
jgi:hypothetical protein